MDQDLNASAALASVFDVMSWTKHMMDGPVFPDRALLMLQEFIKNIRHTFGCFDPETEEIPADVQELVNARKASREAKNFAESDRLRDEIAKRGFEVRDSAKGQVVKKL
jgi:cysteinyl-tRNA synthetase